MAEVRWNYEKLDEHGDMKWLPINDDKGEITGKHIIGLKEYFDENPEEARRLGWIKHITHSPNEVEYNAQTQYLQRYYKQIDDFTIEDEYEVFDKTEEMMLLEEMLEAIGYAGGGIVFTNGEVL